MSEFDPNAPVAKLAAALVEEMGEGWTLDTDKSMPHFCYLDGPDSVRLGLRDVDGAHLYSGRPLGKVAVSGCYPEGASQIVYDLARYEINVSGTRPVRALAGDIMRRLVPEVAEEMVRVLARLAEFATARTARRAVRDELAAVLPGSRVREESDTDSSSEITSSPARMDGYSTWRLNFDGTGVSELTIRSVSTDKARRIAAILAEK